MVVLDIWEVSLDGTPNFWYIHELFSSSFMLLHNCSFVVLDKSMAWNRCLQHPCFKNLWKIAQSSNNSNSNAQHFLLDLLTHSWFHSMLLALPSYQFAYIVMDRCLYLMFGSQGEDIFQTQFGWKSSHTLKLRNPHCTPSTILNIELHIGVSSTLLYFYNRV
jgi:hypothetical protein